MSTEPNPEAAPEPPVGYQLFTPELNDSVPDKCLVRCKQGPCAWENERAQFFLSYHFGPTYTFWFARPSPPPAMNARCDHKFVDSKHCLKCGWIPPEIPELAVDAASEQPVCRVCGANANWKWDGGFACYLTHVPSGKRADPLPGFTPEHFPKHIAPDGSAIYGGSFKGELPAASEQPKLQRWTPQNGFLVFEGLKRIGECDSDIDAQKICQSHNESLTAAQAELASRDARIAEMEQQAIDQSRLRAALETPRTDAEWDTQVPEGQTKINWRHVAFEIRDFCRQIERDLQLMDKANGSLKIRCRMLERKLGRRA